MASARGGNLIIEEDYVSTEDEFNDPFELNLSRIRIRTRPPPGESRYACLVSFYILLILSAFTVVVLFVFGLEKYPIQSFWQFSDLFSRGGELTNPNEIVQPDWSIYFHSYSSQSVVRMFDVDKDGLDDVIFGLTSISTIVVLFFF